MTIYASPGNPVEVKIGGQEFATVPGMLDMGTILISVDEAAGTAPSIAHIDTTSTLTVSDAAVTVEF